MYSSSGMCECRHTDAHNHIPVHDHLTTHCSYLFNEKAIDDQAACNNVHALATMPRSKPAAHYHNQSGTSGGYAALKHKKQTAELAKRRLEMVVKDLKDDKKAVENEKKVIESDKRKFEKMYNELSKKVDKHDTSVRLLREFAHAYKRCTFMQVLISEMKGSSKFKQLATLFQVWSRDAERQTSLSYIGKSVHW